ncbi:MAG TPA: hypothetical protein VKZ63_21985 [Kofleriaceae bacterium]|nr:hypothetical protein [Kofleriaceae bacterium]
MSEEAMNDAIEQADWTIHWKVTETAGLMIYLASYRGRRILWEGSLPYVTIDHQRQVLSVEDEDGGQSRGPFWAPLGVRTLAGAIRKSDFRGGFELAADFSAGPYRYTQLWRFHQDGRMAPWLTIHGGGLHDGHTYHPHWRFDFDLDGAAADALEHFEGARWTRVTEEGWLPHTGEADEDGSVWRQVDTRTGAQVAIRPHHWEDAELFAIRYHEGELPPYAPHAAPGAQPFPAGYIGDESIEGQDVCLWYVAHVHHDDAFPFTAGPWIRCRV